MPRKKKIPPVDHRPWRLYVLVVQILSIAGVLGSFWRLIIGTITGGRVGYPTAVVLPLSAYAMGAFVLVLLTLDVWALVELFRHHRRVRMLLWASFGLGVCFVVGAVWNAPLWQNAVFYLVILAFSWSKVFVAERLPANPKVDQSVVSVRPQGRTLSRSRSGKSARAVPFRTLKT